MPEYQKVMEDYDDELEDEPDKVCIPYADDLLEDAVQQLSAIRPEDYDNQDETFDDFCSAKNPDWPHKDPEPSADPETPDTTWHLYRAEFRESYRPPLGMVFEDWAEDTGVSGIANRSHCCAPDKRPYRGTAL